MTLPTEEDILQKRQNQLLEQVKVWLGRGRYRQERELVARLIEEGHDPAEIAAAALKVARLDEKQRPIAPVQEVVLSSSRKTETGRRETKPGRHEKPFAEKRPGRGSRAAASPVSHESGMVRLSLSLGRDHGLRPADVVGTLAHHADIPGHTLGRIYIEDGHTLVDVPEELVGKVLSRNGDYRFKRQLMVVERA